MGSGNDESIARSDSVKSVPFSIEDTDEDPEKLTSVLSNLARAPCFRESILLGIGSGFAVSLAQFALHRRVPRATSFGVAGFTISSLSSWAYCRYQYRHRRAVIKDAVSKQQRLHVAHLERPDIQAKVAELEAKGVTFKRVANPEDGK